MAAEVPAYPKQEYAAYKPEYTTPSYPKTEYTTPSYPKPAEYPQKYAEPYAKTAEYSAPEKYAAPAYPAYEKPSYDYVSALIFTKVIPTDCLVECRSRCRTTLRTA